MTLKHLTAASWCDLWRRRGHALRMMAHGETPTSSAATGKIMVVGVAMVVGMAMTELL